MLIRLQLYVGDDSMTIVTSQMVNSRLLEPKRFVQLRLDTRNPSVLCSRSGCMSLVNQTEHGLL